MIKRAKFFELKENDLPVFWLSDKLVYEIADEEVALKALQVAEEKIEYRTFLKMDRKKFSIVLNRG